LRRVSGARVRLACRPASAAGAARETPARAFGFYCIRFSLVTLTRKQQHNTQSPTCIGENFGQLFQRKNCVAELAQLRPKLWA
jgi:hypothetical protein